METSIGRQYTLADLEPGWPEDMATKRAKSSPRTQGSMRMSLRRVSRTPENSRAYAHGDPVHLIDWKAFGRTDELVVREHRDEASARVLIVLDLGPTLQWPTKSHLEFHGGIGSAKSKVELAIRLAIYFAYAHLTLGDSVTISCIDGRPESSRSWSPKSAAEVMRVYETCMRQGFFEGLMSFAGEVSQSGFRYDVGWLVSDLLGDGFVDDQFKSHSDVESRASELCSKISGIAAVNKLRVLHVFSWLELLAEWMDGATSYRDELTGGKIFLGDQLKQPGVMSAEIDRWQKTVALGVKSLGGKYLAVHDQMKVSDLLHWLSQEAVGK